MVVSEVDHPLCLKFTKLMYLCIFTYCSVSGTPIGKGGLDDLYGLLLFLRHDPFSSIYHWKRALKAPYSQAGMQSKMNAKKKCKGFSWEGVGPLLKVMKPIFWRHSKAHVAEDLSLPPIHQKIIKLKLSPVEVRLYNVILLPSLLTDVVF
jgi:E3 ubiquitin-protein ligase SHPRH